MDSLENFSVLDTSMFLTRHCTPPSTSAPHRETPQFPFLSEDAFANWSTVTQLASSTSTPFGSRSTECRRPRKGRV